ncbi:MAG TPA: histidinol dehydrogenase [Solirubrobacteraceae bacterium]|nr:histidinol dehydrogenase [Solirubrobacteraceae bacterium]
MRCELVSLNGRDAAALAAELRALLPAAEEVAAAVGEIIERVRAKGDEAVSEYTRVLDTSGREPLPLRVAMTELTDAADTLDPAVRRGLELAIDNVGRVAEAQAPQDRIVDFGTHVVKVREVPVGSAAVYVPGGRAPYPSTVVMGAVTARAAGVHEVIVCSPPGHSGELHPAVLGAAGLTGVSAVYRMGGAQSVAALAYGTESVAAVDVIVGPGNIYVQEAKRQVSGCVGIDGFAGPSDLAVIAGDRADPDLIELDLLAQAEHGDGTMVVAISSRRELLAELRAALVHAPDTGAVARLVEVEDAAQAVAVAEAIAPEHLELIGEDVEALAPSISRAGCVFVGSASATAFGDYITGSNHILPTAGSARFASALSPADFRRRFYEVAVSAPEALAQAAAPLARTEGFEFHARSMEARTDARHDHP